MVNIIDNLIAMMRAQFWSPYLVGGGIGVLSWLTFLLSDHPLGVSSAFAKTAGMVEKKLRGPVAAEKPYYQQTRPVVDWKWMLFIGLFLGALTAAWLSGSIRWVWVPGMWESTFGSSRIIRVAVAMAGGILVGFGARWGCGCTSGHGISGTLQLVISSWISVLCFFVGGMAVAFFLYHVI
ncbi:MAG: YeeE/YedE thiosulfate transporter family protein [Planctomycetota bacterium]